MMERHQLTLLIESLGFCVKLLERADSREDSLTHAQKRHFIQTALILMRDLTSEYERQRSRLDKQNPSDGIPF